METGLLSHKGRVHFHLGECINAQLAEDPATGRSEIVHKACEILDRSIHCGYRIFPCNYIAYDEVTGTKTYASKYSRDDMDAFDAYIARQLEKVDVPDITDDEHLFMRETMLSMYANPLRNQLAAKDCSTCS